MRLFLEQVWKPFDEAGRPADDWPAVRETLEQLRPLVSDAFVALFQQRMTRARRARRSGASWRSAAKR